MECTPVSLKTPQEFTNIYKKTNSKNTIHLKNGSAGSQECLVYTVCTQEEYLEEHRAHIREKKHKREREEALYRRARKVSKESKLIRQSEEKKRERERQGRGKSESIDL